MKRTANELQHNCLQKKEALMDENLPEEYRIELAKAFVNDLFSKVGKESEEKMGARTEGTER
jgi:hypothetical protein